MYFFFVSLYQTITFLKTKTQIWVLCLRSEKNVVLKAFCHFFTKYSINYYANLQSLLNVMYRTFDPASDGGTHLKFSHKKKLHNFEK